MNELRIQELYQLVEACREVDGTELDIEKIEAIAELLAEVERLQYASGQVGE